MTQTAHELWNDINFINKSLKEQDIYREELKRKTFEDPERYRMLFWSSVSVSYRFILRFKELSYASKAEERSTG